jgi:anti-sigma regulatory factor (Ser/Thr protein kinase)
MKQARQFPRDPTSVRAARRFATQLLADAPADTLDAIELMVSELATNCIRHAGAPFEVTITRDDAQVRVEVTDRAGGTPEMRSPGPEDPTGRGLLIVEMCSDAWGIENHAGPGKSVWFRVTVPAPVCTA